MPVRIKNDKERICKEMDILLISNDDVCRSRMAQEILNAFGRGMKITTAGIVEGNHVPEEVCQVMVQHGYDLSRRKPVAVSALAVKSWDFIVTLCEEAETELPSLGLTSKYAEHFHFDDPFRNRTMNEEETGEKLNGLYEEMYRTLFRFYRDYVADLIMPACTCGANTYCRCE